mgnify:CR=1 FL=1
MSAKDITKEKLKQKLDEGFTNEQLAKFFECGVTNIKRRKTEYNLVGYKTNAKPLTNKELQTLESLANKGVGMADACKTIGKASGTVRKYIPANTHKLLNSNSREAFRAYKRNSSFEKFLVPDKFTAYMIGYLSADGNISKDGVITAVSIDYDLIKLCCSFTGANINLIRDNKYYTFTSKDTRYLEKVKQVTNIVPNKTYINYEIPNWIKESRELLEYFLVGVFNADGWAYKVKGRKNTVEVGICQHLNQTKFLKELNTILDLGWNYYTYDSSRAKIQTKNREVVCKFAKIFCYNEFALARKADILLRYSLNAIEI